MGSILIKDAVIITMNPKREIIKGNIFIKDNTIKYVGENSKKIEAETTIDAKSKVIIPGFVQTHIHLSQTLFRGQADDLELIEWLKKKIWPLEAAHNERSLYISAILGGLELIKSGTTTIMDMATVKHTDIYFEALKELNLRVFSGKVLMDEGDIPKELKENTKDAINESLKLLKKWHNTNDGLVQYVFNPRFALSNSDNILKKIAVLAKENSVFIQTHAAENKAEVEAVLNVKKMRNIIYLNSLNLTSESLFLAHCIHIDEEEMNILAKTGTRVMHCPSSNLKLASGIAKVPEMLKRGISVSLGADGSSCNNRLDMFREMYLASVINKPFYGPTIMPAEQVFAMATIEGAKALHLDNKIGSIEEGKLADLVILDLNTISLKPSIGTSIYSRIVYEAQADNVDTTIINGKILYNNRKFTYFDENLVIEEADKEFLDLAKRASFALFG